jgi:hypothetical protein
MFVGGMAGWRPNGQPHPIHGCSLGSWCAVIRKTVTSGSPCVYLMKRQQSGARDSIHVRDTVVRQFSIGSGSSGSSAALKDSATSVSPLSCAVTTHKGAGDDYGPSNNRSRPQGVCVWTDVCRSFTGQNFSGAQPSGLASGLKLLSLSLSLSA